MENEALIFHWGYGTLEEKMVLKSPFTNVESHIHPNE